MDVIYATSELDEWIEVAKNMQRQMQWTPVYWVTSPKNDHKIQKNFSETIRQGYINAVRGKYTDIVGQDFSKTLDEDILEQYCYYEKISIKMMDRMDPTIYGFNVSERTQLYYDFLHYWINVLPILNPDYVIFSESPHGLFHYILYAVCVENNVKVLRFVPTHIEGLTYLSSTIEKIPDYLEINYDKVLNVNYEETFPIANRYLKKNRGTYENALPYYMKDITATKSVGENIRNYWLKGRRFFTNKIYTAYKRGRSYDISDNSISKYDYLMYRIQGTLRKRSLRGEYDCLSTSVDFSESYIYVALHYQPEKTTSPEGGVFTDQWLMVLMLSTMAPKGWKIYVKEHISQFSNKLYGEQGRDPSFYKKVASLNNVVLVNSDVNTFDLIDQARAVATVTGTVGLEAVIRGKHALIFGHAWYMECEGVFDIKNHKDLNRAIAQLELGESIENHKVDSFLYVIESVSFPTYLNPGNKVGVSLDAIQNINNLTACLLKYSNKV